jgi:adenine-specific DNA-methyltransferase
MTSQNTITNQVPTIQFNGEVPHIIKYMGSKRGIINFVLDGINECYSGGQVVDLFAGSSVLSGTLRNQVSILSNDIQQYSSVLAKTYLTSYDWENYPNILNEIIDKASEKVNLFKSAYPNLTFNYFDDLTLEQFNELELAQRRLIDMEFSSTFSHLFVKNYSGTYWSYEQCLWIDAIREVADEYLNEPVYYAIISSLMYAMSYNSQSTGHYAQYRDANKVSSMNDIISYRHKEILPFFIRKFTEFQGTLGQHDLEHDVVSMDYLDCLDIINNGSTVYADPPYCFVHYSRFYHAIETLVRYDYPEVQHKGRYRTDRHQSPFCIKTKVKIAFKRMFEKINEKESNLVLSYSDTGMIDLDELIQMAESIFNGNYEVNVRLEDHEHSTMGRAEDKSRNVLECLVLIKRR